MKKLMLFLLFAASVSFWQCQWIKDLFSETPPPYKTFEMTGPEGKPVEVKSPYVPNEIILSYPNPSAANHASDEAYLISKGFVRVDSCDCGGNLELWRHGPAGGAQDVDLIGVVKDPPPTPDPRGVGEGLYLNFVVGAAPPVFEKYSDNLNVDTSQQGTAPITGLRSILVGVVDGGVNTFHPLLRGYLTQDSKDLCNTAPFGLNTLQFGTQPEDGWGHGTMVNGILAGISSPSESSFGTHIDVLNVKFSKDTTGSLFDAVCGVYYAINHGAQVINASWGFYDTLAPAILLPALQLAQSKNVVLVAGLGNKGVSLDGPVKFWPACFSTQFKTVVGVGALDNSGNLATFSNWSTNSNIFNVAALGNEVLSTYLITPQFSSGLARSSGTSFAAPFVARTIAIRLSLGAQAGDVRADLMNTAATSTATRGGENVPVRRLRHDVAINNPI